MEYWLQGKLTWASVSRVFIEVSLCRHEWVPIRLNSAHRLILCDISPILNYLAGLSGNTTPMLYPVCPSWALLKGHRLIPEAEDKDQNSLWVRLIAYCKFFTLGFFWCGLIIAHMKVINVCLIIDSKQLLNIYYRPNSLLYLSWSLDLQFSSLYFIFSILLVLLCLNFSTDLSENIPLMVLLERRLSQLASHTEFCWH